MSGYRTGAGKSGNLSTVMERQKERLREGDRQRVSGQLRYTERERERDIYNNCDS